MSSRDDVTAAKGKPDWLHNFLLLLWLAGAFVLGLGGVLYWGLAR